MSRRVKIGSIQVGGSAPLALIAGPCVLEERSTVVGIARYLSRWAEKEGVPFIFKASYDKANRSSHKSFRGPGLSRGLEMLKEVREKFGVPVLTDIHNESEAPLAAAVADVLQIPAFLCRQTDLLLAAGHSGRVVNIKKGQFLSAAEMENAVEKVSSTGNRRILITERGNSFGYNDLVMDMRNMIRLAETGYPVVADATHGVQHPGGAGKSSSGESRMAPVLARAAVAAGCDAVFLECHKEPGKSLSDRDTVLPLAAVPRLYSVLRKIDEVS